MTERTFALLVLLLAGGTWWTWGLMAAHRARRKLAGVRLVTCPETGLPAAVTFDRMHAVITAMVQDAPDVQLNSCSRWAERGPCSQPCIEDALPTETSTQHLMSEWASKKTCAYCRKTLYDEPFVGHHVALRAADGVTTEWINVPPEQLPQALASDVPVCWDCHVVETFRRVHPELVTDR
jgi:hypothetical protein